MRPHNLRRNFEELLPVGETQKRFNILSIGCGSKDECIDAFLIEEILLERGIKNFFYFGVDSNSQKLASHFSGERKNNFIFYCQDATALKPSDLNLEANSIDLVIIRHPAFELFVSSVKEWKKFSTQEMLSIFTSKPLCEAKQSSAPWILVPTVEDFAELPFTPVTKPLVGVFRKIIEEVIPKFIAAEGKFFISCYQAHEIAAAIHFSKAYCEFDGNIHIDKSVIVVYQSRLDVNEQQMHSLDGHRIILTRKNPVLEKKKNKCGCPSIFNRISYWAGIAEEAAETEAPKVKFL